MRGLHRSPGGWASEIQARADSGSCNGVAPELPQSPTEGPTS